MTALGPFGRDTVLYQMAAIECRQGWLVVGAGLPIRPSRAGSTRQHRRNSNCHVVKDSFR
jgi:hypothetical protein